MGYIKINYTDESGEPLNADNLNHGEEGIYQATLRNAAFWTGSISASTGWNETFVTFTTSGNRKYNDLGSDDMFGTSGFVGILIPAGATMAIITASAKVNYNSSETLCRIVHKRNSTETTIGEERRIGSAYGAMTNANYPVVAGDIIRLYIGFNPSATASCNYYLSCLVF